MDIKINGEMYRNAHVSKETYADGSPALTIDGDGERIAVVSVWLEDQPAPGCVWVKNYSENAGVLESLVDAGVLEVTGREAQTGFVTVQEARVLV